VTGTYYGQKKRSTIERPKKLKLQGPLSDDAVAAQAEMLPTVNAIKLPVLAASDPAEAS